MTDRCKHCFSLVPCGRVHPLDDLSHFKKFEGVSRTVLEERIHELTSMVASLRRTNLDALEVVSNLQARGTQLLDEARRSRVEREWADKPEGALLYNALHELALARAKHPGPFTLDYMLVVLAEEVGEVARARAHDEGDKQMRLELAQVIGVCLRIATEYLK